MKKSRECPLCEETKNSLYFQHHKVQRSFYRCHICDLIFQDPEKLPSLAEESERYGEHRNSFLDLGYRDFLQPSVEAIEEFYNSSLRGLDYGCGPFPALSQILLEHGISVDLYDPLFFPQVFKVKEYDFLVATEVVEHFHYVFKEWEKMLGHLCKHSRAVIMTCRHDLVSDFSHWHYWRDKTHVSFYSDKTFIWIGQRFGYKCDFIHPRVVVLSREESATGY